MNTLVFDTEFVWVPGCERQDKEGAERIPHPPNASIESIAYVSIASPSDGKPASVKLGVIRGETERERVVSFVRGWHKNRPRLVTYGGRQADVPLLVARLMHHGVVSPQFAGGIGLAYRFRHEQQLDLYDVLGGYGAQRSGGLDDWARCIGWPGKGDTCGDDVKRLITEPGGRAKVDAYCLCDAVQTAALLLRYELTLGALEPAEYTELAGRLLHAACADDRTLKMAAKVDASFTAPWPHEPALADTAPAPAGAA